MRMKLIYGQHKQALLDHCLEQIARHTRHWPDRRAFLIVPETAKADTERRYLEKFDASGLMMAEVLSFRRLAYRLFSEAGGLAVDYVSPAGKTMLLQSLIRQHRNDLKRFAGFAGRPGYAAQIESVLGDFQRYNLSNTDLMTLSDETSDPILRDKLHDFSILSGLYHNTLQKRNLTDPACDLDRLADLLQQNEDRLRFLHQTEVWVHGFGETRDLTTQEYTILDRLSKCVEGLTVTVCADMVPADWNLVETGSPCFRHGRAAAFRLATRHHPQIETIKPAWNPGTGAISELLISDTLADPGPLCDRVRLIRSVDRRQELAYVAGEIRRLIREHGYRYRDIAVAVCDLTSYRFLLQSVFREFELESFIEDSRPLIGTVLMRYVRMLLALCRTGEKFDSLMGLLRTGLTQAPQDQIDEYENICLALGLQRFNRFWRASSYDADQSQGPIALMFWQTHIKPLQGFAHRFNQAGNVADRCTVLLDFLCVSAGLPDRVGILAASWKDQGEIQAALTLVQSWNGLNDLLEEMVRLFDRQPVSSETFSNILTAGMSGSSGQVIPVGLDRIAIGDARQMYQHPCKILFVLGADQQSFPSVRAQEGLLRNSEREAVEELSKKAFPNQGRHRLAEESYRQFALLTLPQKRLYLSCPSLQNRPSISQQRLFDHLQQELVLKKEPQADVRYNSIRRALRLYHFTDANDASLTPLRLAAHRVAGELKMEQEGHWGGERSVDFPTLDGRPDPLDSDSTKDAAVAEELVLSVMPARSTISVSRVQQFNSCPYAHYANYLLALQERDIRRPDARLAGSMLHVLAETAFAELSKRMKNARRDAAEWNDAQAVEIFSQWQQEINSQYIERLYMQSSTDCLSMYADPIIRAGIGRRLCKIAEVSIRQASGQIDPTAFMPAVQEWRFPDASSTPLILSMKQRELVFKGVIDRVDLHADQENCRIIDYKSGRLKLDYHAVYHGLQLQLPVYMHAWLLSNPQLKATAAGYFHFDHPIWSRPDDLAAWDSQNTQQKLAEHDWLSLTERPADRLALLGRFAFARVVQSVEHMMSGRIAARPACMHSSDLPCKYCDYQAMCRYDQRTVHKQATRFAPLELPGDYPGLEEMKAAQKKTALLDFMEQQMEQQLEGDQR